MTVKMSISLTDQQAEYARQQVAKGRFASTSAVIQQALEAKRREEEEYQEWKAGFFGMLEERSKGPFVSEEEFESMVADMLKTEGDRLVAEADAREASDSVAGTDDRLDLAS